MYRQFAGKKKKSKARLYNKTQVKAFSIDHFAAKISKQCLVLKLKEHCHLLSILEM
jgi:hypothetical protein